MWSKATVKAIDSHEDPRLTKAPFSYVLSSPLLSCALLSSLLLSPLLSSLLSSLHFFLLRRCASPLPACNSYYKGQLEACTKGEEMTYRDGEIGVAIGRLKDEKAEMEKTLERNRMLLDKGLGGDGGKSLLLRKDTLVEMLGRNKKEVCDTMHVNGLSPSP